MKVGDLRKAIEGISNELPVVLATDEEGNRFSPLYGPEREWYVAESSWSGFTVHPDDYEEYKDEAELALVLYPVN